MLLPSSVFSYTSRTLAFSQYPETVEVLQAAYRNEIEAHLHYAEFSRKAVQEDYPNIAYLFTALATSELIHAQIFQTVLSQLGENCDVYSPIDVGVSNTKANLEKAAKHEIQLIEEFYPESISRIEPEKHASAVKACMYSWKSHKQHRDHIDSIAKWTGIFFKHIAEIIEKKTDSYFVCTKCGATQTDIRANLCPICHSPVSDFKKVERDAFLK